MPIILLSSVVDEIKEKLNYGQNFAEYIAKMSRNSRAVANWIIKLIQSGVNAYSIEEYLKENWGQDIFLDKLSGKRDIQTVQPTDISNYLKHKEEEHKKRGAIEKVFQQGNVTVLKATTPEAANAICLSDYGGNSWCTKSLGWAKTYMTDKDSDTTIYPFYVFLIGNKFAAVKVKNELKNVNDQDIFFEDLQKFKQANPKDYDDFLDAIQKILDTDGWETNSSRAIKGAILTRKIERGEPDLAQFLDRRYMNLSWPENKGFDDKEVAKIKELLKALPPQKSSLIKKVIYRHEVKMMTQAVLEMLQNISSRNIDMTYEDILKHYVMYSNKDQYFLPIRKIIDTALTHLISRGKAVVEDKNGKKIVTIPTPVVAWLRKTIRRFS